MERSRSRGIRCTIALLAATTALCAAGAPPAEAAARPMPIGITGVRVAPAGVDQVRVTWHGGARTTKYAFLAGSTSMTDRNHFQTGWIRASDARIRSRSIVLTVPARLRAVLGAGSGDYVFVKIAQTNATGSPAECRTWTPASLCRASASGAASVAGAARPAGATVPVSVASWNVQSVTATAGMRAGLRWAARRPKVVRTVLAAAPDVLGTEESTTARLDPSCLNPQGAATPDPCAEQYSDLGDALAPGYSMAGPDAWQWVYAQQSKHSGDSGYHAYVDSAIYYRSASIDAVDHGFVSPVDDLGLAAFDSSDEAGAWALLTVRATGTRFLAVSMHLPVGDGNTALRRAETTALARWLTAKSAAEGGVPVVLTADLNSYAGTDPHPAVVPLRAAGFSDAASTPHRTNARWSSTNSSNGPGGADGYPSAAVAHPYPTNRIDAVLTMVPGVAGTTSWATRYENVVHRTADGRHFDADFQGSDHDLQLAHLLLPVGG